MDKKTFVEKKIFYPRAELVKDFLFSILDTVERTYLGDELMNETNQQEHFEYCLSEVINNFSNEGIVLHKNLGFQKKLFEYFNKFYYSQKKSKQTFDDFRARINSTFTITQFKSNNNLDELVSLYKNFDENLGVFF
jgi:hypothetical protein